MDFSFYRLRLRYIGNIWICNRYFSLLQLKFPASGLYLNGAGGYHVQTRRTQSQTE